MAPTGRSNRLLLLCSFAIAAAIGCGSEETVGQPASGGDADTPLQGSGGNAGRAPGAGGLADASGGDSPGTGGDETGVGGAVTATGGAAQGIGGDPGSGGSTGGAAGAPVTGEYGFNYRVPQTYSLYCSGYDPPLPQVVPDTDWICTFDHAGTTAVLYVQATPVSCMFRYSIDTEFATEAWISIDGQVTSLPGAQYDWGNFHHIDYLTFEWEGRLYEYGHSSLADNRICHPMDCMTVFETASSALLEDGCTSERTLPVACVQIALDGTHQDLTDYFTSCEDKDSDPAFWCERSGGAVGTTFCCSAYDDFPPTCGTPLTCSCDGANSRDVTVCTCPESTCFDGRECVLRLN